MTARSGPRAATLGVGGGIAVPNVRALLVTHWPVLLAVAVTLVLGIPTLIFPYGPDQALFAYFGDRIAHGAGLYVDVWDVKPPGVFWVYTAISVLPGPPFKVLRAADLLYTAATVIAIYAVASGYWGRIAGCVAGGLYGGTYVTATGYWHTAQPDSFMVLPLMLMLLAWRQAQRGSSTYALLAGVLLGVCTQMRPVVLLVGAMLIAIDLYEQRADLRLGWRTPAVRRAACLVGGALGLELITVAWLALYGAVGEYFYAQLVFASRYGRQGGPYSPDGLTFTNYLSGLRTGTMFIIFARMLLAAPALFAVVAGAIVQRDRRVTEVSLLALAAFAGVAVQAKFFLYHWHLLLPFLALLAGWSASFLWQRMRDAGRSAFASGATLAAIGALLLLLTPAVTDRAGRDWLGFVRYVAQPESRHDYFDRFGLYGRGSFSYRASDEVSRYLRERTEPGDTIFVWGYDPLVYVLSDRDSSSRFVSFLPLMSNWTPRGWQQEFVRDLEEEKPAYVLTQRGENAPWITGHTVDAVEYVKLLPDFQAVLDRDYEFERNIEDYFLYRRK